MARHGTGGYLASGAVIAVTGAFLFYALADTRGGAGAGAVRFRAVFTSSSGLSAGAPVTLGGIVVGRVLGIRLDDRTLASDVAFDLRRDIPLPTGSVLSIASGGFGGGGSLVVTPGKGPGHLSPDRPIVDTEPARSLQAAVGDYIFGAGLSSGR